MKPSARVRLFLHAKAERACVLLFRRSRKGKSSLERELARALLKRIFAPLEFNLRKKNLPGWFWYWQTEKKR